jgi:tetratricopeptide (TPR) repeat protein
LTYPRRRPDGASPRTLDQENPNFPWLKTKRPADAAAISRPETPTPEEKTLTEKQLESFTAALEADPKDAYGRWGLALFHTLSDEQAQAQLGLLKINAQDALGHYNQGVVLASKGKFADAARAFAQAPNLIRAGRGRLQSGAGRGAGRQRRRCPETLESVSRNLR